LVVSNITTIFVNLNKKIMLITTELLEKYHNDGLLLKQTHPVLDLTIWNYL